MDSETFHYPKKIAKAIGLSTNEINAMKRKGLPFYGRKTNIRLVRAFMYRTMGAESLIALGEHPQHSDGSKSDAQA